jgi:hypothetical protein
MDRGELVPDTLTVPMVLSRIEELDCVGGVLDTKDAFDRDTRTQGFKVIENIVCNDSWKVEETYIKVKKVWMYPTKFAPRVIHVDKNAARPKLLRSSMPLEYLPEQVELGQITFLNNLIEQAHRCIKRLLERQRSPFHGSGLIEA